jgi:hypothetical protein
MNIALWAVIVVLIGFCVWEAIREHHEQHVQSVADQQRERRTYERTYTAWNDAMADAIRALKKKE